jgi:hypothetical protein
MQAPEIPEGDFLPPFTVELDGVVVKTGLRTKGQMELFLRDLMRAYPDGEVVFVDDAEKRNCVRHATDT